MKKYHEDVPPELLLEFGLKRFQQERGMELLKEVGRRIMQAKLDIAMDHWRLFVANGATSATTPYKKETNPTA